MKSEIILGAAIAAIIGFLSGFLALMSQDGVAHLADIGEQAWWILGTGAVLNFLKDFQAVATRNSLAKVTGSGNTYPLAPLALLVALGALFGLGGCTGTRDAYQQAEGLDETAKVVAEHYTALLQEANNQKDSGALAGQALERTQELVRTIDPLVKAMDAAAQAFEAADNAQTEQELSAAIDRAVIEVAKLVDLLKGFRARPATLEGPAWGLPEPRPVLFA
jgi:hypothetical protein